MGQPLIRIGSGTNDLAFVYDGSRNMHPTVDGFTLYYDQNSPPAGFEDKFYVGDYDFDTESDGTYIGSVTTSTDHFTYTGLEPGRVYHVRIFRYVNSVYNSTSWPAYGVRCATLETEMPIAQYGTLSLAEHWSKHFYDLTIDPSGTMFRVLPKLQKGFDADMGDFIRVSDPDDLCWNQAYDEYGEPIGGYAGHGWVPWNWTTKYGYPPDTDLSFERKVRFHSGASNFNCDLSGPVFHTGEFAYAGPYLYSDNTSPSMMVRNWGLGVSGQTTINNVPPQTDDAVHLWKTTWTASTRRMNFYIDNVLVGTYLVPADYIWKAPIHAWFHWFAYSHTDRYFDFGELTVTVSDNSKRYATLTEYYGETLWTDEVLLKATPIATSEGYIHMGGVSAGHNSLGDGELPFNVSWSMDWPPYADWVVGTTFIDTPLINLPDGFQFSTIKLNGRQNNGSLKVQVVDGLGALVSDSLVPGNSTGFFPDDNIIANTPKAELSISIAAIMATQIKLRFTYYYDGTTIVYESPANPGKTPSLLQSFTVEMVPVFQMSDIASSSAIDNVELSRFMEFQIDDMAITSAVDNFDLFQVVNDFQVDDISVATVMDVIQLVGSFVIADISVSTSIDNISTNTGSLYNQANAPPSLYHADGTPAEIYNSSGEKVY